MPSLRYDPGIRRALRALNRIPGVTTRASCQGKNDPRERSTHADLAYVLFRNPIPIALEERLLDALGDVARVTPDSIYSLWPDRNAELCVRLGELAAAFGERRRRVPRQEWRIPLDALLEPIGELLEHDEPTPLEWCLDCAVPVGTSHRRRPPCRVLTLLVAEGGRRREALDRFLAADPSPPDPRLREREGDAALIERIRRGDFGGTYHRSWQRFLSRSAKELLRDRVRASIAGDRATGDPIDYHLQRGIAVISRETRPA